MENFVYTEEVTGEIVQIPVKLLHHHHDNPRKDLGDLTELTESIKAKGVLQNLTVVPFWFKMTGVGCDDPKQQAEMGYLVVIGNRRLEAAKKAGLETLPCIIAKMTPAEQVQTMLLENMQRTDLTAYEQAQGFQMMLDFGDTVKTVAEKTGFSVSTIRRRLEWAKLDAATMGRVASRQISLMDLDKLSKIDDIETRNKVLCEIGTNNFENKLQEAIRAQEDAKFEASWREALTAKGAIEVSYKDLNDYTKYEWCVPSSADFRNSTMDVMISKLEEGVQYYFCFRSGWVYFRRQKTNKPVSPEQEARKRAEEERTAKKKDFAEMFNRAYMLRVAFVDKLSETAIKKKADIIIAALIRADWTVRYCRKENQAFADMMGVILPKEAKNYGMVQEATEANPFKALLSFALYSLGENEDQDCLDYYNHFVKNERLQELYDVICALGYQMSDEEKSLMDGTHELYTPRPSVDDDEDNDEGDYDGEYGDDDDADFEDEVSSEDDAIIAALEGEASDDEQ